MQNNVAELTHRLLQSLDDDYNVTDMPAVVEIISLLENVAITKELLEATRLGKHINELRRKTTNEGLSKRAKGLLKKWRSMVLPDTNGQVKTSPPLQQLPVKTEMLQRPVMGISPPLVTHRSPQISPTLQNQNVSADVNLNQVQVKSKKRPAKEPLDNVNAKRARVNGVTDLEFSDNSNSSFKDVISTTVKTEPKRDVIVINSDSNSSYPEKFDPQLDQVPKRRGRKKGSKNHKSLLDEAETSFTNKLAVSASRGNSKVKTTQELLASIQNKNSIVKPKEDLMEKAAKLTERVSEIDQKLNTNASRNKNKNRIVRNQKNERVIESGSVINDKSLLKQEEGEDEVICVDEEEEKEGSLKESEEAKTETKVEEEQSTAIRSLSVEEALALLPPIDKSVLLEDEEQPNCSCYLKENKTDFSVDEEEEVNTAPTFEFIEDHQCRAKEYLQDQYHLTNITDEMVHRLHSSYIPNVNGIYSLGEPKPDPQITEDGLYVNVVPNIYEKLEKDFNNKSFNGENFQKYSVSERDSSDSVIKTEEFVERTENCSENNRSEVFKEWYECAAKQSYDGEVLKILPYTIID